MSEEKTGYDFYWTDVIANELFDKLFLDDSDFSRQYTFNSRGVENKVIKACREAKIPIPYDIKRTLSQFYARLMTTPSDDYNKVA